jgi:hypothetical protein
LATVTQDREHRAAITRHQRDVLHGEIRTCVLDTGRFGDLSTALERGEGAQARDVWTSMADAARLLDQIGWDKGSDRDVYTLTVDDAIARFARWLLEQTEGCLSEHAQMFAGVRAGEDPWGPRDYPEAGTLELDFADLRDLADRDLEVAAACRAILRPIDTD